MKGRISLVTIAVVAGMVALQAAAFEILCPPRELKTPEELAAREAALPGLQAKIKALAQVELGQPCLAELPMAGVLQRAYLRTPYFGLSEATLAYRENRLLRVSLVRHLRRQYVGPKLRQEFDRVLADLFERFGPDFRAEAKESASDDGWHVSWSRHGVFIAFYYAARTDAFGLDFCDDHLRRALGRRDPAVKAVDPKARTHTRAFTSVDPLPPRAVPGTVEVLAVDAESGDRVAGVCVKAEFSATNAATAVTGADGRCQLSVQTVSPWVDCHVLKVPTGYYEPFTSRRTACFGRWDEGGPWQPEDVAVTMALQRVEHPIPLVVRKVSRRFKVACRPGATNEVAALDLMAGKWLPPYGRGTTTDMVVRVCCDAKGAALCQFLLPGAGNGFREVTAAGSDRLRVRRASAEGLVPAWPGRRLESDSDRVTCASFRVRTKFGPDGSVSEGHYGKVNDVPHFWLLPEDGTLEVVFTYYLNPTPLDRNLEWAVGRNLDPKAGDIIPPLP